MIAISVHSLPLLAALGSISVRPQAVFLLLNLIWGAYEVYLGVRRRAGHGCRDGGTLGLLWRVLMLCIAAAVLIAMSGHGRVPASWLGSMQWIGSALLAGGLLLRAWSIHVLARFFTVDVSVQAGHQLVERGPYRWVRHPSYTGALLAFLGLGVGLGNAFALPVLMLPVLWAFWRRIAVEEAVLREAFPGAYAAYAARTGRLLPLLLV